MLKIKPPLSPVEADVVLPFSKSISNRLLILQALSPNKFAIKNLSDADDTALLQELLQKGQGLLDARDAGTAFRFLTAYCSLVPGKYMLTGTERMMERPVGELVDALRLLGASIEYAGSPGFPPLHITGGGLHGGEVELDGRQSSQFASALLLIAPFIPGGLRVRLSGSAVSASYIDMTIRLMKDAGWKIQRDSADILIPEQQIKVASAEVEPDWSSATFWFEFVALYPSARLRIKGLRSSGVQGDQMAAIHFKLLGIDSKQEGGDVLLTSAEKSSVSSPLEFDLRSTPDLAPALIMACAGLKIRAVFTGLSHLRIKESDRLEVLAGILSSAGVLLVAGESSIELTAFPDTYGPLMVNPKKDHRIAMAAAMFSTICGEVVITDERVVAKSYPEFWHQLSVAGFELTYLENGT